MTNSRIKQFIPPCGTQYNAKLHVYKKQTKNQTVKVAIIMKYESGRRTQCATEMKH